MTAPALPSLSGPQLNIAAASSPTANTPETTGFAAALTNIPPDKDAALRVILKAAIDYHDSQVAELHTKADRWLALYHVLPSTTGLPWVGASNFTVPFMAEKIMSMHARIVRSVFNVDPLVTVKPRVPDTVDFAPYIERWMDYLMDRGSYRLTLDITVLYSLLEGTGIAKVDYLIKQRQVKTTDAAGQVNARPFTEFEGPRALYVPLRDFVIVPLDVYDIDQAQGCGFRFTLSDKQLLAREANGTYQNAKLLVDRRAKGDPSEQPPGATPAVASRPPNTVYEGFTIYELYWKYDLDDDGEEEPLLITYSKEADLLLRVIPFPYDHGKAPFVPFRPMPQPNSFYGSAVANWLEPINVELTSSFRRRADAMARAALSPIKRLRGSLWNPGEEPLKPNGVITVGTMEEIQPLILPDLPQSNIAYENMLIQLGERITGISDFQLGRSPGANRTFGEVRSVLSEGEVRLDVMLSRIQESMRRLAELTFDLAYQMMPYGGLFAVGRDFFKITPEAMRPPEIGFEAYEFVPNGTLSEASKDQALERTVVLLDRLNQNQLLMNPQLNPNAPYIAALGMKKLFVLAGWQDWEKFLPQIAQYEAAAQQGQPNPLQVQQSQQQQAAQQQQAQALQIQQQQRADQMAVQQGKLENDKLKALGQIGPQLMGLLGGQNG